MRTGLTFLALLAATPAAAQFAPLSVATASAPTPDPRLPVWREVGDIRARIDDGRDAGQLTRRDARRLRRAANAGATLADRAGPSPTDAEQRQTAGYLQAVRDQVMAARSGVKPPSR